MKQLILFLSLFLLFPTISLAQSDLIKETIQKIEFQQDTIQSVFNWVTDNIKYDVGKLNDFKKGKTKNSNFKTEEEFKAYLLKQVVKWKKGVCEDYALLFDEIVKELGYESKIISGYTKNKKGKINRSFGHAWNAVKVNNTWKLYDPTWGAGYVEENKRFVKNYNKEWYETSPAEMIKTHMPYDPIWQLLSTPVSYKNFESNTSDKSEKENYDFESIIQAHQDKDQKVQMQDQVNRSIEMGDGPLLVTKWRKRMTKSVGLYGIVSQQDLLEEANERAKNSVELYNKYINAKNKQFKGKKWSKEMAQQYIEEAKSEIEFAQGVFTSIDVDDKKANRFLSKNIKEVNRIANAINQAMNYLGMTNE